MKSEDFRYLAGVAGVALFTLVGLAVLLLDPRTYLGTVRQRESAGGGRYAPRRLHPQVGSCA